MKRKCTFTRLTRTLQGRIDANLGNIEQKPLEATGCLEAQAGRMCGLLPFAVILHVEQDLLTNISNNNTRDRAVPIIGARGPLASGGSANMIICDHI